MSPREVGLAGSIDPSLYATNNRWGMTVTFRKHLESVHSYLPAAYGSYSFLFYLQSVESESRYDEKPTANILSYETPPQQPYHESWVLQEFAGKATYTIYGCGCYPVAYCISVAERHTARVAYAETSACET